MPSLHAKKGPSGAKQMHECPGAGAFKESLPFSMRAGSGPAARKGTAAHTLLETALREGVEPVTFKGRLILTPPDPAEGEKPQETVMLKKGAKLPKSPEERARCFEVDNEMLLNVDTAWVYVVQRAEAFGIPLSALQLETKTNPCPERDDTWGTADITLDGELDFESALEVVDYKNGRRTVDHRGNPQVLAYLAGRAHDTGWRHDLYFITIVQPNGRHEDGRVRTSPVTKAELLEFVEQHRTAAIKADLAADEFEECDRETKTPHGQRWAEKWLKAGDHCTFCDARPVCAVHLAWVENMARQSSVKEFADILEKSPEQKLQVEAVEQAKTILRWRHLLVPQFKAAERFLDSEARAGRIPPEWKLIRSRSYSRWRPDDEGNKAERDPDALAFNMYMDGFLTEEQYLAGVLTKKDSITGPQARALVPAKLRPDFNARYLHTPPGALKLVPESAPGEAVVFDAKADFAEVIEEDEEEY